MISVTGSARQRIVDLDKRLMHQKAVYDKRIEEYRNRIDRAREEARRQTARANRLNRRLLSLAVRTASERVSRAIRGKLNINSKTHDVAMLEEPIYYVYYLMHNGQNRRFSDEVSTEKMPDFDWDIESLRGGLADGMGAMDADGNVQPISIDLGHIDADGNPVVAYSGNLGTYRYERRNIPTNLKKHLSQSTIDTLESAGQLKWNGLTVAEKRDIYRALADLKQEARDFRSEVTDARQAERRKAAREAARAAMGRDIGEVTDEMRQVTLDFFKENDPSYSGTPSDADVWDYISKHPDRFMDSVKPPKGKERWDSFKLSFLKIQRIARFLDGGKDDGPFQRIFVRAFQDAYDNVLRNIDRRLADFQTALEGIIGKKGSKTYNERMNALRKNSMHFTTNALQGGGRDATLMEVMGMYIYSQNINGMTKLVATDGNNFTLESIARVNPEKVLEYIELEETLLADKGRDTSHPTPLAHVKNDLADVKNKVQSGAITNEVPEWVRNIGDMMIDQLAKETPRLAEAAYSEYNTMLQIQDRYFPLVQASRGSWGDMFGSPFKGKGAQVNAGSLNIRQKNARYPLMLDPMAVFISSVREQENLIGMTRPVADASYMLKFGNLSNVVSNRFGDKWAKALDDYVKRIASPENSLKDLEKLMNRVLGNAAAAKIGLNLMTTIKQFVSVIPAAFDGELSPADIINGISHILAPGSRRSTRELMDRVAYSTLRSGYNTEISRMQGMTDTSRATELSQRFIEFSTWLTSQGDQLSKMLVWSAKYDKEIRAGKSETDAAYEATNLVNRTLSVTNPISLAQAQTNRSPFARVFFMFTNDLFQMWNTMFGDIPMDFQNREWGRMFAHFGGVALSAAALGLLAGGWLPDDDDDKMFSTDDFLLDFMQNMLGYSIPMFGQLASEWARGYSQSIISMPDEIWKTGTMIYQDLRGNKEYTPDEYFDQIIDTLLAGGELAGVPTTGPKRPAQSAYDFDSGEWRINLWYLFGTRWGEGGPNLLSLVFD